MRIEHATITQNEIRESFLIFMGWNYMGEIRKLHKKKAGRY